METNNVRSLLEQLEAKGWTIDYIRKFLNEVAVKKILGKLGLNKSIPGYNYLVCIILCYIDDCTIREKSSEKIYDMIANVYQATKSSVQNDIRSCITFVWEGENRSIIKNIFRKKPKMKEFITIIGEEVKKGIQ